MSHSHTCGTVDHTMVRRARSQLWRTRHRLRSCAKQSATAADACAVYWSPACHGDHSDHAACALPSASCAGLARACWSTPRVPLEYPMCPSIRMLLRPRCDGRSGCRWLSESMCRHCQVAPQCCPCTALGHQLFRVRLGRQTIPCTALGRQLFRANFGAALIRLDLASCVSNR